MFRIGSRPSIYESNYHEYAVVLIVMITQALNIAGSNQSLPMMNELVKFFDNVTNNDKVWFLAAFPLTAGTFILISGEIGDIYGLKRTYLCGAVWSTIWTLLTGLSLYSKSVVFFCICRGCHGIGVSFMLPNGIGILGNTYKVGQRKALVFCLVAGSAPIGSFCSVVICGLTALFNVPQWAFYSNSISFALLFVAAYYYLPEVPRNQVNEDGEENKMDWMGSVLGVVGLVLFNFAWNQAPQASWKSPYIIILLIIGILFLIAFFQYEKRVTNPLLPPEAMNIKIGIVLAIVGLGWASFSVWGFYYWSFILNLRGYNPLIGGVTYVPLLIFGVIAAMVVSMLIPRIKSAYLLLGSAIAFFIGITMLATTPVHQTYYRMIVPQMIILSFGMDMSFPGSSLILSDNLPKKHQGMASSLVSTTTNYAMSIGLGIASNAEVQIFEKTSDTLKSYRAAMYVGIGFAVVSIILGSIMLFLQYYDSFKKNKLDSETPHIDQHDDEIYRMHSNETA